MPLFVSPSPVVSTPTPPSPFIPLPVPIHPADVSPGFKNWYTEEFLEQSAAKAGQDGADECTPLDDDTSEVSYPVLVSQLSAPFTVLLYMFIACYEWRL